MSTGPEVNVGSPGLPLCAQHRQQTFCVRKPRSENKFPLRLRCSCPTVREKCSTRWLPSIILKKCSDDERAVWPRCGDARWKSDPATGAGDGPTSITRSRWEPLKSSLRKTPPETRRAGLPPPVMRGRRAGPDRISSVHASWDRRPCVKARGSAMPCGPSFAGIRL